MQTRQTPRGYWLHWRQRLRKHYSPCKTCAPDVATTRTAGEMVATNQRIDSLCSRAVATAGYIQSRINPAFAEVCSQVAVVATVMLRGIH